MEKIWQISPKKYDDLILQLLFNRELIKDKADKKEIEAFLEPEFELGLNDPFLLPNSKIVLERIVGAINGKEVIGIFADYDADGVPGAALFWRTLNLLEVECHVYIPTREEGYGLNRKGIDYLKNKGCTLILTIDLGIRSFDEADCCRQKKIDLIITDHHIPDEKLPKAFAIINPKLDGSLYPNKELCGCGVAYKIITGLAQHLPKITESFLKWNLDLVAISTVCDMVPLREENRILVKFGLKVLQRTRNVGLKALYQASRIDQKSIDPYIVGFQIGSRLNTPGRIDHASRSFDLLITEDKDEAKKMAEWLNEKNAERQQMMDTVLNEAIGKIEENKLASKKIIVVAGKWNRGVLGPPASKLVEKYFRPVILLAKEGVELVGSARSIPGVHILELLESVAETLERYGGHKGAAGLTLAKKCLPEFLRRIEDKSNAFISDDLFRKTVKIDAAVDAAELNLSLCDQLEKLEPYGVGNPKPIFFLSEVKLDYARFVGGEGRHLSAYVIAQGQKIKSIFFNFPADFNLSDGSSYDIIFYLTVDAWNGSRKVCLNILDIREHVARST